MTAVSPDPVTLAVTNPPDPPDQQPDAGSRIPLAKPPGGLPLRVGVVTLWLSIIVLLPVAAIAWQAVGSGWEHFWLAVTSHTALESFKVTLIISVVVTYQMAKRRLFARQVQRAAAMEDLADLENREDVAAVEGDDR